MVMVTRRAALGRLNRKLAKDDQMARHRRSGAKFNEFGEVYVIETARDGSVVRSRSSLAGLLAEYDCLKSYEELED